MILLDVVNTVTAAGIELEVRDLVFGRESITIRASVRCTSAGRAILLEWMCTIRQLHQGTQTS